MLIRYDRDIIYRVYLPEKEKIICIKDLKMVKNTDRTKKS